MPRQDLRGQPGQAVHRVRHRQYRDYDQRDRPEYGEVGHGPWCFGLPNPPVPVGRGLDLDNGTDLDSNAAPGNSYFPDGAEPGPTFPRT